MSFDNFMRRKELWVAVSVAVAAAMTYLLTQPSNRSPSREMTSREVVAAENRSDRLVQQGAATKAAEVIRPKGEPNTASATNTPAIQKMCEEYRKTTNFRAFIQSAMNLPEAGGRFYSALAFVRCQQLTGVTLTHSTPDTPRERQRAIAALEGEILRCSGVMDQFGMDQDPMTFWRQVLDSRGGPDALMPDKGRGVVTPHDSAKAASDFSKAVSSGDPYLIAVVLEANIDSLASTILSPE